MRSIRSAGLAAFGAVSLMTTPVSGLAAQSSEMGGTPEQTSGITYADLADLSDASDLVVQAELRRLIRVEDERAPGLQPGFGRFYVRADTQALLFGDSSIGESLAYLVDLPLDARGRSPKLERGQQVLLFARPVPGRPGELQLITPRAQIAWDEQTEATVRSILNALVAPDAPPSITGVREIIHVPGTLAGEGETQIFLSTADGSAASITVRNEPGAPPAWGVSFSELVADTANPPRPGTLEWYRLACFLPGSLPPGSDFSETSASRWQAQADYRMVLDQLGPCSRTRQ